MLKRFYKHLLIVFSISLIIILISINFAIPQNIMNNNCAIVINLGPDSDRVSGQNWSGTVTIDFYDQGNGSLLYTTQADIDEGGNFDFWLGDFDIQPGHFVTATDGITRKELVVTSLAIDEIDMDADTISGTTEPGAQIRADGGTPQDPTSRNTTADVNGYWIVDFSVPQVGNPTTWDLVPGSGGVASEADFDCDETSVWWLLPLPGFSADPVLNRVSGNQWLYSDTASIYIDNNDDLSDGYLWSVENVVIDEWDNFMVWLEEGINLQVGHFVTVTDGITTKYHVVTSLRVDEIDIDADTVSGTAEHPNAQIRVDGSNPPEPTCRHGWADEEGKWTVDFKVPQPGSPIWDLVPDSNGLASERDNDGDETTVPWPITNESPIAVCKDIEIPVDENCQANITPEDVDGGSYDPDEGDTITLSIDNIGSLPLGENWVSLTVTDESGKSDTCQALVTVIDTTPPEISVSVSPNTLWPPNHKMVDVGFSFEVSDICDPDPAVSIEVTSDEPTATAPGAGGSKHAPDAEVTEDGRVLLRAERSGKSDGRVYQLTVTATDACDNSSSESVSVKVNHDKKKEAIDSGQNYDATEIN